MGHGLERDLLRCLDYFDSSVFRMHDMPHHVVYGHPRPWLRAVVRALTKRNSPGTHSKREIVEVKTYLMRSLSM
jgi:hypothetical protein